MSCGNCGDSNCLGNCGSSCSGNPVDVPCSPVAVTVNPCVPTGLFSPCNTLPGTPTPYFAQSGQCQEDHCQTIIKNWFSAAICVTYGFNIPGCGLTAIVIFQDLKKLVVDSYVWHPTYGYFKIISFDFTNGQVIILNECQDGNGAPGTFIPACTCFIVAPTPVDVAAIGAVCVSVDFTAPANGDCLTITVTNVNGLEVGGQVSIGSGLYRLEAVVSPTLITICNDGTGITPGTPVIAKDANGNYQYCLSVIGSNPCTKDAVTDGTVMVCVGDTMQPLDGITAGNVLTLVNPATNSAHFAAPSTECCDSIRDDIATIVADGCVPQITAAYFLPAANYSVPITLVSSAYETVVDADLITITFPNDGCTYYAEGCFQIAAVVDYVSPGVMMSQIDVTCATFTTGSFVWTDFSPSDGFDTSAPGSANAICQLLPSPTPNLPVMYHGASVIVPVTGVAGNTRVFGLSYRCFVGLDNAPSITSVQIRVSGIVKLWRA